MTHISEFITLAEYRCSCCGQLPPDLFLHDIRNPYRDFFDTFDSIRDVWGKAIPISSGYRCKQHNHDIGGSPMSVHLFGLALDMDFADDDETERAHEQIIRDFPGLRVGKYIDTGDFIHIDMGYEIHPRASHFWQKGARWVK